MILLVIKLSGSYNHNRANMVVVRCVWQVAIRGWRRWVNGSGRRRVASELFVPAAISWSARCAIVARCLFLRYWLCLRWNFLEGSLAKLVGIRDWRRTIIDNWIGRVRVLIMEIWTNCYNFEQRKDKENKQRVGRMCVGSKRVWQKMCDTAVGETE